MASLGRRRFLKAAGAIPVLVLTSGAACYEPGKFSFADRQQRKGLNFKDVAPDPARACAGCSYFTARGACGSCRMLNGGAVSPGSGCDYWVKRK